MVALKLRTSHEPQPDFLSLPWDLPLEEWPDELAVRLPRGRHRHIVRFIDHEDSYFALKELPPRLAEREYDILSYLNVQDLPSVQLVGIAHSRGMSDDGFPMPSILITRHLSFALPYVHLFRRSSTPHQYERLIDALTVLLVRIHLAGIFWGDCSLGNALFRRDGGALVAYLVDTETAEHHGSLTDGQRAHDLQIAQDNIAGGLYELEAMGRLDVSLDPAVLTELLYERYTSLWNEVTGTDELGSEEMWRIRARLERLNDLGFDTAEIELNRRNDGSNTVTFRPRVVEEGHSRRLLNQLTGINAGENQARRLLDALATYGAWLRGSADREIPDAVVAFRWLTERYEPTLAAIPNDLRGRRTEPELYLDVLDHHNNWSRGTGADYGLKRAVSRYVREVLPTLEDERVVLQTD